MPQVIDMLRGSAYCCRPWATGLTSNEYKNFLDDMAHDKPIVLVLEPQEERLSWIQNRSASPPAQIPHGSAHSLAAMTMGTILQTNQRG